MFLHSFSYVLRYSNPIYLFLTNRDGREDGPQAAFSRSSVSKYSVNNSSDGKKIRSDPSHSHVNDSHNTATHLHL